MKFWSDDFDMDLLKVFPDVERFLGATASIPIWTLSHETHGRLNCPTAWNTYSGLTSLLWLEKPNFSRDTHGWVNINGCVTNDPEIEGTWLEWLRDQWAHGLNWVVLPGGIRFSSVDYNKCFYPIMSHRRGWSNEPNIDRCYKAAEIWLTKANRRFARAVERFRLGSEDCSYFASGSVPGLNAPRVRLLPMQTVATQNGVIA